ITMATTTGWQKAGVLGAAVAATALLAGCGGAGESGGWADSGGASAPVGADAPPSERTAQSPLDVVRAVPDAMKAAGTSRFEQTATLSANRPGAELAGETSVTGSYDFARRIGDGHSVTQGAAGTSHVMARDLVFTSDSAYNRTPGETRWRKTSRELGVSDPTRILEMLDAVTDARAGDTVRVRDVEVQQYTLTIDPMLDTGATAGAGAPARPDPTTGTVSMTAQMYVDTDGRVRRLDVSTEISSPQADTGLTSDIRIDFFDFGVPVTTQVPDPSLVDAY
ncbi:MAG: hypothetical protein ACRDXB_06710, partial [Actinomycetes bacterium]